MLETYDGLSLALFSGKGGVGKTTLSSGFARRWAKQFPDRRILLLSTDPAHSLGDVLGIEVDDRPTSLPDLPNLSVRALDARQLLDEFRGRYGEVLELLVERGSFVDGEDLSPAWEMGWPGLDELMGILEIQRLLEMAEVDRIVVDMAPSGHSLNLFGMMDFLDNFLEALDGFQEKHRVLVRTLAGKYRNNDAADLFIEERRTELAKGRALLQDPGRTACVAVAIAEPMSLLETQDFLQALERLQVPSGGIWLNRLVSELPAPTPELSDRLSEQQELIGQFQPLSDRLLGAFFQAAEPIGSAAIDGLIANIGPIEPTRGAASAPTLELPSPIAPHLSDFIADGRRLLLVGGKGGVGKTTVTAAIGWGLAQRHPDRKIHLMSIDPAHSLGDSLGLELGHETSQITENLSAQEIDSEILLQEFREDYLWELAEMMSGQSAEDALNGIQIAYGPAAWRQMVSHSLPGVDEILALLRVVDLLEAGDRDLIVVDTAPTGHLLRFLEMPEALTDWLGWIFKLWLKYQDVAGHTELMTRLRQLRKRVTTTQKKLQEAAHTEAIGTMQANSAILAETERMVAALDARGVSQRFLVHNRYEAGREVERERLGDLTVVRLPALPRAIAPLARIKAAARCLFGDSH